MPGRLRTTRPRAQLREGRTDWYRITNSIGGGTATVHIYDEIGGYWGVTASDFVRELSAVNASQIDVHINSPGGEIFEGIAIANALRAHAATVVTYVDSLAASIASVIALAGDRVVMAPNSQLMIHDGSGICFGNAADMREMADLLDRQSDNIADVYATKAGGTVEEWRALMMAETWYTAAEAVAAGLADEVIAPSTQTSTDDNSSPTTVPTAQWDLSVFRYAGRDAAPEPVLTARAGTGAPAAAVEPADIEPAIETPSNEAADPAPEPDATNTPEPAPAADDWASTIAHLTTTPSAEDAFRRLREALL
ncbi:head maturation protease, ClpP-related [Kitasatospora sp. NPDC048298]|uniref:head maturation protease, ClpP-related n=1 Tax=Kitasatospora sp. NPDC048298 TaxID=3364049 RepID=UPI0037206C79